MPMKRFTTPGRVAVVAVAVLVAAAAGALALEQARSDHIVNGVTIAGLDVGGMSAEEASSLVRDEIGQPLRRTVAAVHGDRKFELEPHLSRIHVNVESTVEEAVAVGRSSGVPGARAVADLLGLRTTEAEVEPRLAFSHRAVGAFAHRVAEELEREPIDATVEPSPAGLATEEAVPGVEVDRRGLFARLTQVLVRPGRRVVEVPTSPVQPAITLAALAEEHPDYLIVDRAGFRLLHYEDLELRSEYPISVGDIGHATPAGVYEIENKAVDPTWYVPDSEWAGDLAGEVIPPGPENPIKSRWLGIHDGIGIHGTDEVDSIGRRASRGCIRMLIADVEELYERIPVGTSTYIG